MEKVRKLNKRKIVALGVIVVAVALLAWFLLSKENIDIIKYIFKNDLEGEAAQEKLQELGIRGYLTISIMSLLQVVLTVIPSEPIEVLSGLTFGFLRGTAAVMAGVVLGNTVIYLLYRVYGDKLREYFDEKLHIDIAAKGSSLAVTVIIFVLYLLPAVTYGFICFLASAVGMKYPRYIIVTTLGAIPSVCIGVALGHVAITSSWILSLIIFLVILALLIPMMIKREALMTMLQGWIKDMTDPHTTKIEAREYGEYKLSILNFGKAILFFLKGVRVKHITKTPLPEGACIVLVNHGAFGDFAYAGRLTKHRCPNFVVARLYFCSRKVAFIAKRVGCFPKSMFTTDLESARNCIRVLKRGGVLVMMPEARLSTAGEFEDIQPGTYSFLKHSGVPIYTVKINGDYLAQPKWGNGLRRGSRVVCELDRLISAEELKELSVEEVGTRVEQKLYYNEFEWLKSRPDIKYKSRRLAEGLENILAVCPRCGAMHSLKTKKRTVSCESCGYSTVIDSRYGFSDGKAPENVLQWYRLGVAKYEELASDPEFSLTAKVKLKHSSTDGVRMLRDAGEGECRLAPEGLYYVGTDDGAQVEEFFPILDAYRLLFGAGENFEVYRGREIWFFTPEDTRTCVGWYILSKIYNDAARASSETV